jgi:hypothetical protein
MKTSLRITAIGIGTAAAVGAAAMAQTGAAPAYSADGKMLFPADYREWVYLTSGLDMTYGPAAPPAGQHRFDNVFVDPAAYRAFKASGTWPDKTVMVLEVRKTAEKGSINQAGQYQTDVAAIEVHVKDKARFKDGWGFFGFNGQQPSSLIPATASCYSCHADHGVVDTTFVQFYPTLLPIAQKAGTVVPEKETRR